LYHAPQRGRHRFGPSHCLYSCYPAARGPDGVGFKAGTRHHISHYHAADRQRWFRDHRTSKGRDSAMAEQDDVLHLIDDSGTTPEASTARKWKVAVIDDDQAVHEGTRFALSDYNLNGQTLEILSAYSGAEGRTLMQAHPDIAAVLLDVIMETD